MLVVTGGLERTPSEHQRLLDAAGFAVARIVPTRTSLSVLECAPT
jgi:hypothetical protein